MQLQHATALASASVSLTRGLRNVAPWTDLLRQRRSTFQAFSSPSAAPKSANVAITPCCYLRLELLAGERNAASLHLRCLRAWPSLSGLEAIKCSTSPSLIRSNQQRIWYLCLFKQTLLLFGEKTGTSVATSVSISLARLSAPWASSLVAFVLPG
nr:uncharacterized protein LOC127341378 [Lolium perenne]XP_051223186.1 uncharacterized protein LOC127341389 [Lolium perenne]